MTKYQKLLLILFLAPVFLIYFIMQIQASDSMPSNTTNIGDSDKLRITHQLEDEGIALFRQGRYEEAEQKFIVADDPKYWLYEGRPNGMARYWLRAAYVMQGKFENALENLRTVLAISPDHQPYLDEKIQYQALIKYRDESRTEPIYEVIENLKTKYADLLPPKSYDPIASLRAISAILRLYDTIGDHDAGIAFVDKCLKFFRESKKGKGEEFTPGKNYNEYLKVREAFEKDKAEGTKGRATQVLIQSDYFPW